MKRHPDLREFSDDHHGGLVQALRLRRSASGAGGEPAEVVRSFLEFWREDTAPHFRKEEEALLPVVATHAGELLDREPVLEMLVQHARIRGLAMRLGDEAERGKVRVETLQQMGELLETHIRLEERIVFPIIEEVLSENALKEVAAQLAAFD